MSRFTGKLRAIIPTLAFGLGVAIGCAEDDADSKSKLRQATSCELQDLLVDLSATAWLDSVDYDAATGEFSTQRTSGTTLDWYYGMGYVENASAQTMTFRLTRERDEDGTLIQGTYTTDAVLDQGERLWITGGNSWEQILIEVWSSGAPLDGSEDEPDFSTTVELEQQQRHIRLEDDGSIEPYVLLEAGDDTGVEYDRHYVAWGDSEKLLINPPGVSGGGSLDVWVATLDASSGDCVDDWSVSWTKLDSPTINLSKGTQVVLTKADVEASVSGAVVAVGFTSAGSSTGPTADGVGALADAANNYLKIADAFPGTVRVEHFAKDCKDGHVPVTVPMVSDRNADGTAHFVNCTDDTIVFADKDGSAELFSLEPAGMNDENDYCGEDNQEVLTWDDNGDPTMILKKKPNGSDCEP